ncbi:MAG: hypothetical protein AB7C97_01115 [Oscillospiraceae bacterium]
MAFLLSLVGLFLPISFEWDNYSNYVINWFIAALNCEHEPIILMILMILALFAAVVAVLMRKPLIAFVNGILFVVLFVALFLLVPDTDRYV